MKKSYLELFTLIANLNMNVKDGKTKGQKKLQKIAEKVKPLLDGYNEKVEEIRLDCASVDSDGNLILDEKGGYKFSKENIKKLGKESRALNEEEFEVEVIQINNPEGLEDYTFLEGWTNGIKFNKKEIKQEEDVEL